MKNKNFKIIYSIFFLIVLTCLSVISYKLFYHPVVFKLKGPTEMTISYQGKFIDPGFSINDDNKKREVSIVSNINPDVLGTYQVTYRYKKKTLKRLVTVVDDIAPTITLKGTGIACPNKEYKEEGYTITDNYDKNLNDKVKITKEKNKIIYEVTDSSNNKTTISRSITYLDKTPPTISFTNPVIVYKNGKLSKDYQATDNCDGTLTNKVSISKLDTSKIGNYKITYQVTDSSGNTTKKQQDVIVKEKEHREIYLTFDDGPSSNVTPKILDILKKYNIKATFFVLKKSSSLDYLLKREYNEGHTIGYHTASHDYSYIYKSEENFWKDIDIIETKVKNLTGYDSKIFRFPGGSSNTVSSFNKNIMTRLVKQSYQKGYIYQDWNVSSGDVVTSNSTKICNNVIKGLNNTVNIVLMHDASTKQATANALECIIQYGLKEGYTFNKITSSTKQIHHLVNN